MYLGLCFSLILHSLVLLCLLMDFPVWHTREDYKRDDAIAIDFLPITNKTNLPPNMGNKKSDPEPEKQVVPPPPATAKTEAAPAPIKEKKTVAVISAKKEASKEKEVQKNKKEEVTDKDKDKDKTKNKKKAPEQSSDKNKKTDEASSFDKMLKNLEEALTSSGNNEASAISTSPDYDPSQPLSVSEQAAIRSQLYHCWNEGITAGSNNKIEIILNISLEIDGTVKDAHLLSDAKPAGISSALYQAAVNSAIRAVYECSPLKNLPKKRYEHWKELEFRFGGDN